ncbi:outer dynein arm-docking complex subunit 2-like isoform X3 [Rhopilema esculentum]|uniref:outer dynein arm-docking complex subunit 2-like isoform X3 n=1 Tax=Rhopilema esculentum TaxID=499914 RepID=UPI0031E02B34
MGATLSSRAELTSANPKDGGKIEFSPHNEALLNNILHYVETLTTEHQKEAQVVFKQPFQWSTGIRPVDIENHISAKSYETSNELIKSEANNNGEPHLSIKKTQNEWITKVYTFEQMGNLLNFAGEKKLEEIRACLEANRDPMALIMGPAFAKVDNNDDALLKAHEMVSKARADGSEDTAEIEDRFRLLLLINQFDIKLLHSSLKDIAKDVRVNPASVESDFNLIKGFSGSETDHAVEHIDWMLSYVFTNGCRAPPWRQVHGDIAYIEVKTKEQEVFPLTASTSGYYVNKGMKKDGEIDYARESDVFPNLIQLLKAKSSHFADVINSKEFRHYAEEKPEEQSGAVTVSEKQQAIDKEDTGRAKSPGEAVNAQGRKDKRRNAKAQQSKKDSKQKSFKEPSQKWKQLNLVVEADDSKPKGESRDKADRDSGRQSQAKVKQYGRATHESIMKDFSESSSESEEEEESQDRRQESNADLPSEYWQIQKLVKYLKGGNQTATIIALCAMRDFNLAQETCQLAIRDVGGLEVLINLLETNEIKCKIGALKILKEISKNTQIRKAIADLGGLQTMVKILQSNNKELKCLAAETIANVAKFRRARRTVRKYGGIHKLVALLDCGTVSAATEIDISVARAGAMALWSCSKSTKNKNAIRKAGGIPLLAKLLKSSNESMLIPVVGTLQECATEESYRLAIRTEGMIEDLVLNLNSNDQELQRHCASAIFKCAEDAETRDLVREYGGLDPLVSLLANSENKDLLAAATGAIWKCAISEENVLRFQELKAIEQLVTLLNDQPEEVLINVVGALGECAKISANRTSIRKAGGISPMVNLLTGTNQQLLVNVTRAVGEGAKEPDNMAIIDRLDGVRLLWSLLKSSNPQVQASAAWAICPCIENAKDAGEMVRSFVGGLELIVSLLKSEDKEVLASVCAAIANIAKDEENLAVITDHGVVPMLARLTNTADDKLRHHLAEAIARCCTWGNNRVAFGQAGAVAPLVHYLKSKSANVHRSTAKALFQLSRDPDNCIAMHNNGVVKPLLAMVGASDDVLQEAAAGCLANIRKLALANEKAKYR